MPQSQTSPTTTQPVSAPIAARWRCTNCGHIAEYQATARERACCACGNADLRPA